MEKDNYTNRNHLFLYDYEWKILKEGKDKKTYYPFSHVEMLIPWVFGFIYFVLGTVLFLR